MFAPLRVYLPTLFWTFPVLNEKINTVVFRSFKGNKSKMPCGNSLLAMRFMPTKWQQIPQFMSGISASVGRVDLELCCLLMFFDSSYKYVVT